MYGGNMHPQQAEPEIIANCKCDAGFYVCIPVFPLLCTYSVYVGAYMSVGNHCQLQTLWRQADTLARVQPKPTT